MALDDESHVPASQPFELHVATRVVCEPDAHRRVGALARLYGHRVLLVAGTGSAAASGALGAVEASLTEAGCEVALLEGIPGNPTVSVVDAGSAFAREAANDVVVAVGGGSVLDAAKAIAAGALRAGSIRGLLSGIADGRAGIAEALPVIAIPTLAGAASETNGTSVLVDDATGRKLSLTSPLIAPRIALVSPDLLVGTPAQLAGPGYADALCHAVEAALSTRASAASDAFAESAVRTLLSHAPRALGEHAEHDVAMRGEDAVVRAWWGTVLAGYALSLAGSIVTHPLAHPLSARLGARHADTVAALEPVVIRALAHRFAARTPTIARWFGSRAVKPESAARALAERLAAACTEWGAARTVRELGFESELVADCAYDALNSGSRGLANTPGDPLTINDLRDMYAVSVR